MLHVKGAFKYIGLLILEWSVVLWHDTMPVLVIYICCALCGFRMIAAMSPEDSWVCKWQRISKFLVTEWALPGLSTVCIAFPEPCIPYLYCWKELGLVCQATQHCAVDIHQTENIHPKLHILSTDINKARFQSDCGMMEHTRTAL